MFWFYVHYMSQLMESVYVLNIQWRQKVSYK